MTQETRRDLRFPLFCVAVVLAAALLSVYLWWQNDVPLVGDALVSFMLLLIAVAVTEFLAVALPNGPTVSLSYPLSVAALVLLGPTWGTLVTAISAFPTLMGRDRPGLVRFTVNTAQTVLSAGTAGLLFAFLGGRALSVTASPDYLAMVVPFAAVATAGILSNAALLAVTYSLLHGQTFMSIWREVFAWSLPSQIALGFAGVAIAVIVQAVGWGASLLFVLPLLLARQTYQQSVKLREAYADTISSLVAALEAKDVYTKGHSVRVAEYTVWIAEAMGFSPDKVRRLEQAALLHDLGKVGVSRRVLAKEARLTDEEYDEIKRHPDIGAHIVADVPYLADLVPIIEHHHERIDGRGYGGGTSGTDIPLGARILAVADSYDAMTSARPYRGAMCHAEALKELRDNCGTQFDPEAVAAFELGYERATRATAQEVEGGATT